MKKVHHILIHLFLLGMLLTVFQYLPVLEEETSNHLTELTKKVKENNPDDNDADDDDASDNDDDVIAELFFTHLNACHFIQTPQDKFYLSVPLYQSLTAKVNTPPPKA